MDCLLSYISKIFRKATSDIWSSVNYEEKDVQPTPQIDSVSSSICTPEPENPVQVKILKTSENIESSGEHSDHLKSSTDLEVSDLPSLSERRNSSKEDSNNLEIDTEFESETEDVSSDQEDVNSDQENVISDQENVISFQNDVNMEQEQTNSEINSSLDQQDLSISNENEESRNARRIGNSVDQEQEYKSGNKKPNMIVQLATEQLNQVKDGRKKGPSRCDVCNRVFQRKSDLLRHLRRVHLKERRFRCNICDQGFSSNWDLRRHTSKF